MLEKWILGSLWKEKVSDSRSAENISDVATSPVALIVWFTTNGMCAKNNNIWVARASDNKRDCDAWSLLLLAATAKLCTHAARAFRSQHRQKIENWGSTSANNWGRKDKAVCGERPFPLHRQEPEKDKQNFEIAPLEKFLRTPMIVSTYFMDQKSTIHSLDTKIEL